MKNIFKDLRDYWYILAFLVMLIIWYANVNSRLAIAEEDIKDLKVISQDIVAIKTDVATIKATVEFLKQQR